MSSPAVPGIIHRYARRLVAFEHTPDASQDAPNRLLFIGGLGDGLGTVPFVDKLAEPGLDGWNVVEVLISSSYSGFGTGSVKRDAEELAQCVEYFRDLNPSGKLVLMGHSTGSQDTMQYLLNSRENKGRKLDGAILQAPVSDREALVSSISKTVYLSSLQFAETWVKNGQQGKEIIPRDFRPGMEETPVSAERWFSIAAPLDVSGTPQGSEDFFSSDINDGILAQTFGRIPKSTPLLILYSGNDQYVPPSVDKEALVKRWVAACAASNVKVHEKSGVIPGGNHNMEAVPKEVMEDFVGRVYAFLQSVGT